MIILTANICFDGYGGSVFEDQVDHFSVDKVSRVGTMNKRVVIYALQPQKYTILAA